MSGATVGGFTYAATGGNPRIYFTTAICIDVIKFAVDITDLNDH